MSTPGTSSAGWRKRFASAMPTPETLAANPWLKPVAHRLLDPALWHAQQEAVARGVAIGVFWAFAIPFAQFIAAAAHCVWWRANIPVAAAMTLITNPFTVGFWVWLAYKLGRLLLDAPPPIAMADGASLVQWVASFGGPALLGMGIFAVLGSAASYVLVKLIWTVGMWFRKQPHSARL